MGKKNILNGNEVAGALESAADALGDLIDRSRQPSCVIDGSSETLLIAQSAAYLLARDALDFAIRLNVAIRAAKARESLEKHEP